MRHQLATARTSTVFWLVIAFVSVSFESLADDAPDVQNSIPVSGLERSMALPVQQSTIDLVQSIEELLADRTSESEQEAARLLQTLLSGPDDWIPVGALYQGAYNYALQRIRSLSKAGQAAHLRFAEPLANQALVVALRDQNPELLRLTALQVPLTPSGQRADLLWRSFLRDQGWVSLSQARGASGPTAPITIPLDSSPGPASESDLLSELELTQPLPDLLQAGILRAVNLARSNARQPVPLMNLSVTPGELLYQTALGITRVNLQDREQIFEPSQGLTDPDSEAGPVPLEQIFFDQLCNSMAVHEDLSVRLQRTVDINPEHPDSLELVAVKEGHDVWRLTAIQIQGRFLSPPASGLDRIWILSESTEGNVHLVSILPGDGRLAGKVPLGQHLIPWIEDFPRQGRAGLVVPTSEAVYCLTGSGAVIAIDPAHNARLWGLRIPRDDTLGIDYGQQQQVRDLTRWSISRRPQLLINDTSLALVLPESDWIHLLDRTSGVLTLSIPSWRDDRLLSLEDGSLLIDSISAIRSVHLPDGQLEWTRKLNEPGGRGVLHDGSYLYPTTSGEIRRMSLSPETGPTAASEITLATFSAWKLPEKELQHLPVRLENIGGRLYRLSLTAVSRIELDDVLDGDTAAVNTQTETPASEVLQLLHRFSRELHSRDWNTCAKTWLEIVANDQLATQLLVNSFEGRVCRTDRLLQGELFRHYALLTPAERSQLGQAFEEVLRPQLANETRIQLKLLDRAGDFPWVWKLRVSERVHAVAPADQAAWQIQLLRQIELATVPWSSLASLRLAEVHAERAEWRRAETLLHRFLAATSGSLQSDPVWSMATPDQVDRLRQRIDQQLALNRSWPQGAVPTIHRTERFSTDIFQEPLPRCGLSEGSAAFADLMTNWPGGTELQWMNSAWPLTSLTPLPAARNPMRSRRGLNRCWELGNLVVVQAGAEVFGFWQQTSTSMPEIRRLWPAGADQVTTLPHVDAQPMGLEVSTPYSGHPAFRDDDHVPGVNNQFGQPIGVVGPVTSRVLLLRQEASLCALDPVDGSLLWKKESVPELERVFADPLSVFLLMNDPVLGHGLQELNLVDGSSFKPWAAADRQSLHVLKSYGTSLLTRGPVENGKFHVSLNHLGNSQPAWSRDFPDKAVLFSVDSETFGVADPQAGTELVKTFSGETLSRIQVNFPAEQFEVFCTPLQNTLLIGLSRHPGNKFLETVDTRLMRHRRFLDGTLFAVDRRSGELLWQQQFEETLWNLNQLDDLPVFVISEPRRSQDGFWRSSRLRVYDLSTGTLLLNEESSGPKWINVVISGHLARKVIRIRSQNEMLELRYHE